MDRREAILTRLVAVAGAIDGVVKAERNRTDVTGRSRPAIIVLDADETVDDIAFTKQGRPANAPNLIDLKPEIVIMVGEASETVGPLLNSYRAKFLKAVVDDAELRGLVGASGHILYEGCATDLTREKNMAGEMRVAMTFRYTLRFDEL